MSYIYLNIKILKLIILFLYLKLVILFLNTSRY